RGRAGARIVMLEPRRLAARGAASYMAHLLGEAVGRTVGYRIRHETKISRETRIEVVTEGVLTRMLIDDPTLEGIGAVVFDEFHERSIHADTGLALTLQTRALLRPELRVLVMSATLDAAPVAALLDDAPVVRSEGRTFPVETHYLDEPLREWIEPAVARAVRRALANEEGDVLVFLPGAGEIRRVQEQLRDLPGNVHVHRLHGSLTQAEQDAALARAPAGARKVVLSSAIAETSLTIEGIRVVIDSGLMRVPRFSPRIGMTQLVTVRVSRASADQRRGRAGRTAPGVCYRMWTQAEDAALLQQGTPEILEADLAPLALELAAWGTTDPSELGWLDAPPAGAYAQARSLLRGLDAIDDDGRITAHGTALSRLPLHPRLAHMLLHAQRHGRVDDACMIAALLEERDILRAPGEAADPDLLLRLDALHGRGVVGAEVDHTALARVRRTEGELRRRARGDEHAVDEREAGLSPGLLLALAYPDRVGRARGGRGAFVLRNGRGARVPPHSLLASAEWIVAAQADAQGADSRVLLGAALDETEVLDVFGDDVSEERIVSLDGTQVRARIVRRLDAIVIADVARRDVSDEDVARAVLDAIATDGIGVLPWSDATRALRERLAFLHAHDPSWPDASDGTLAATAGEWLVPFLVGTNGDLGRVDLAAALMARVDARKQSRIDALAPTHIEVPSGSKLRIDYSDPAAPVLAARVQELFGWTATPRIADGRVPLTIHLLSPAHRPVQVTRDLASFWRTGYFDVRRDLRGRYPKHYWPEDPLTATATRRVRPQ
ncbi:MAG: ATP-dependent helicase HrpB, partial [Longimicrobiales bacterium]